MAWRPGSGVLGRASLVADIVAAVVQQRSVVLHAPAGMGKTTTLRSVVSALKDTGSSVLRAAASTSAQGLPFGAFAGVLTVIPGGAYERISGAVGQLQGSGPNVVVVDDAHLLDDESASLVHHLVLNEICPVFLSIREGTSCPDAIRRIWADELALAIAVPPLSDAETDAMCEALLGGLVDRTTLNLLCAAGERNPLMLREVIEASRHVGLLTQSRGVWSAAKIVGGRTVGELMRERIDRWDVSERWVASLLAAGGAMPLRILEGASHAEHVLAARRDGWVVEHEGSVDLLHGILSGAVRAAMDDHEVAKALTTLVATAGRDDPYARDVLLAHAGWLIQLGEAGQVDASVLAAAAEHLVDMAQPHLAVPMAEAAVRLGGGAAAREWLVRATAQMGTTQTIDPSLDAHHRDLALHGRFDAYVLGFDDGVGLRSLLLDAAENHHDPALGAEFMAYDAGLGFLDGGPLEPHLSRLLSIHRQWPGHVAEVVAAELATQALRDAGKPFTAMQIIEAAQRGRPPDNIHHRAQLSLAAAEAHLRAGRMTDAKQHAAQHLYTIDSPIAAVYGSAFRSQVALAEGRPDEAARSVGSIIAMMGTLDAAGVRTWSESLLQFAQAWSGLEVAAPDPFPRVIPAGRHLLPMVQLFCCRTDAAQGRLRAARRDAIALAERAHIEGRFLVALEAVHLAVRVEGTQALQRHAEELSRRCEGDLAPALAAHVAAVVSGRADALEQAAKDLETCGQLAYAREAFGQAADAYAAGAQRAASTRCRAEGERLGADGVAPSPLHRRQADYEALTPRELEIALLAADGLTNRELAERVGLSRRTVETHLQNIYRKLQLKDRANLQARLDSLG